jgi:hypothetical protein
MKTSLLSAGLALAFTCGSSSLQAAPVTFLAAGADAAAIAGTVDAFRASLGSLNANVAGSFGSGRREINWDGVPNGLAAPGNLPANFFNTNSPRGAVFTGPGTGFQVSGNAGVGPIRFNNINPTYSSQFDTFSAQRLFTSLGSNVYDVLFFVPGSTTPALVSGFGSVFTDVDAADTTSIEYFDALNNSLGTYFALDFAGDQTLAFVGVDFDANVVSRIRVTAGNQALGPITTGDVVVADDFIYGEPVARSVPEPSTLLLVAAALFGALRKPGSRRPR